MNNTLRSLLAVPIAALGLASIIATGGGGSDLSGGGNGDGVHAYNFTATNMQSAAQIAVATQSLFPEFRYLLLAITDAFVTGSAQDNNPFDLGMCAPVPAGTSVLTWQDVDTSGDLSVGDTANLTLTSCDLDGSGDRVDASIDFTYTAVSLAVFPKSVAATLDLTAEITEAGTSGNVIGFTGLYDMQVDTGNDIDYTITYTGNDPDGLLTGSLNGVTLFKYGCFSVAHSFSLSNPGPYSLAIAGVVNVDNKIMTLAGGPTLNFLPYPNPSNGSFLDSGQKSLISLSVPECEAVDAGKGVDDSTGTYVVIKATGGGNVTLELYDNNNALQDSIDTTWDVLD